MSSESGEVSEAVTCGSLILEAAVSAALLPSGEVMRSFDSESER